MSVEDTKPHATLAEQRPHVVDPKALHRPQSFDWLGSEERDIVRPPLRRTSIRHREDLVAGAMHGTNASLRLHLGKRRAKGIAAHLKQVTKRTFARQPVPPLAVFDLRV